MTTLIMTVFNEVNVLPDWFQSIEKQTEKPDGIVIVDGYSDDGTWEMLQTFARQRTDLKIIRERGNIAHGRNTAIAFAEGDIIAVADAGCVFENDWLSKLVAPLRHGLTQWSATGFGPWLKEDDAMPVFLIAASTIPCVKEFETDWLPSSRSVAFRKDAWKKTGGYPEWIPYCEDLIFDKEIAKQVGDPMLVRQPLVFWRPRQNFKKYFRQLFNYTRSDGHGELNTRRQFTRYAVYVFLILSLLTSMIFSWLLIVPAGLSAPFYLAKFWQRWIFFTKSKSFFFRIIGFILLPFVVGFGDIAKMIGWPVGVYDRLTGKIKKI